MKMTFHLPDDLMVELKLHASSSGVELDDAAVDLLRKGLATTSSSIAVGSRPVIKKRSSTSLPYIECPLDAPARRMTVKQLIDLDHETQTQQDLGQ
jgi:hypothetical protein